MTTPVLPSQLIPIYGGYTTKGPSGVKRTEVKGGSNRYALDYDRGMVEFNITFNLSEQAHTVWQLFYHKVIKKGVITFQMNLDSGFGLAPHNVNIIPDSYSSNYSEFNTYIVSFTAEGESNAYSFSDEDAEAYVGFYSVYGESSDLVFDRLDIFATVDTLALDF